MSDDGPLLIRPVPQRPFSLRRQSATPTDDEPDGTSSSTTAAPAGPIGTTTSSPGLHSHLTAALAAWNRSTGGGEANPSEHASPAISRPASIMNLTSSTLYGIYSPTTGGPRDRDDVVDDSPWGMGAQTPVYRPGLDEPTFALMRERSHLDRRRSSYRGAEMPRGPSANMSSLQVALRTALLFVLGLGYGALVTRLHDDDDRMRTGAATDGPVAPRRGFNSTYLGAWGVAGVVLGSLLPWFDGVWEAYYGVWDAAAEEDDVVTDGDNAPSKAVDTGLDYALVMRAIGSFVGIFFAIVSFFFQPRPIPPFSLTRETSQRKLAWDSTLQISATLALANPLLWWLIDRSMPGLLLSAAVGVVGSLLLLGISPDMMPTPSLQILRQAGTVNGTGTGTGEGGGAAAPRATADNQTIETGVWMVSVLFCSCLCFGNIGRRLFTGRTSAGKTRWGGVR
ncbi:INSIG domain protein [Cordyceps fumosorosea ARSEF 2679]|uniref:INSIG domain protein n=1 Tax=Cordyceps fumosorosea (strain ARSEF 2679) TaxID=1081104 RepID=A0A167RMX4_CORFA|nr:INSIG domain protein [Cordyceps fumosorosea ARSEF 2679]OAA58752.1 INSIG domain protein [Cordyceps fumosorosea ARSEF 2679]